MGFAAALKELTERRKGDLEAASRQAMILAAQSIVLRSPVDTGRFRANWQFGVGALNSATTTSEDPSGAATISALQGAINNAKIGGVWYATNSLPYANRLEYGWSDQAPGGMVRLTAQELPDMIRSYLRASK